LYTLYNFLFLCYYIHDVDRTPCNNNSTFSFHSFKFTQYCSKKCARVCNSKKQYETTLLKNKINYENSEIYSFEELKLKLEQITSATGKDRKLSLFTLNKHHLGKSLDYYIKDDVALNQKARILLKGYTTLPICKKEDCNSKVKKIDYEYCSVSCQSADNSERKLATYFDRTAYTHPKQ